MIKGKTALILNFNIIFKNHYKVNNVVQPFLNFQYLYKKTRSYAHKCSRIFKNDDTLQF